MVAGDEGSVCFSVYGPHKTLYNRFFRRWAEKGVFQRIFAALAAERANDSTLIIDATHIKAHRTAANYCCEKGGHRCLGRTRGGLNSKLHVVCSADGKPLILLLTEGQFSDCKAAFALLEHLPPGSTLIVDKAYDSHRLRHAYFLGANDPYKSLKTALKAEIDQEA